MKHHKGGHGGNHQKTLSKAKGHEMGKSGDLNAVKESKDATRNMGEGLGSGYNAPDRYQGGEDGPNRHCC